MPEPQPIPPSADALRAFLAAPEADQLRFLELLPPRSLTILRNRYLAFCAAAARPPAAGTGPAPPGPAGNGAGPPLSMRVYARLLALIDPLEYDEAHQPAELREALMPAALKSLREASYEHQLGPLLNRGEDEQTAFVSVLSLAGLVSLRELLSRYGRERGKSLACRSALRLVAARIEELESGDEPCEP